MRTAKKRGAARPSVRRSSLRQQVLYAGLAVTGLVAYAWAPPALAGATVKLDDDRFVTLGAGLRTSYNSIEDGAPNGTDRSNDVELDSLRLYTFGQLNKVVKATFNTDIDANDRIRALDVIAQFEFTEPFNIWFGRFLPPSDRSNQDGPFYLNVYEFPFVSNYPAVFNGRTDGAMVWGKFLEKKLVYGVGAFESHNSVAGGSNQSDDPLYAARVVYNFWEAEDAPGIYNSSTYYGKKDILTLGLAGQFQENGVGVAGAAGDYTAYNVDLLFEKKIGAGGAFTVEGAYYRYNLDATDCGSGEPGSAPCPAVGPFDNTGGQVDGKAYLGTVAFLIPGKVGIGQFMPHVRYQRYDRELSDTTREQTDVGVHYVIDAANARITAAYIQEEDDRAPTYDRNRFQLGVQLQY